MTDLVPSQLCDLWADVHWRPQMIDIVMVNKAYFVLQIHDYLTIYKCYFLPSDKINVHL